MCSHLNYFNSHHYISTAFSLVEALTTFPYNMKYDCTILSFKYQRQNFQYKTVGKNIQWVDKHAS